MTKQHFIAFAKIVKAHRVRAMEHTRRGNPQAAAAAHSQALAVQRATIEVAQQFNTRFDKMVFIAACTPEGCETTE
jgi:hypothetical protein